MNIMQQLDRLIFFSLCALVFVLPASTAGVGIFSALAILFLFARKIIQATMAWRHQTSWQEVFSPQISERALLTPLIFLTGIELLSVFWSSEPALSLSAFFGKVLKHLFIYWAVLETVNTPRRVRQFLYVLILSAGVLCLDALIQFWTGQDLFKKLSMIEGRVSGSFKHPNGLAGYLVLVIPVLYGVGVSLWRRKAAAFWSSGLLVVLSLLGFVVMGLTYSRGAWLGLCAAMMALVFMEKKQAVVLGVALALFLGVFIPLLRMERNVSLVTEGQSSDKKAAIAAIAPTRDGDWIDRLYDKLVREGIGGSDRLIFWHDAFKIIQDHPWTGTGLNTYSITVKHYSESRAYYPHNCYLQITGELGIFGLLFFLWFLGGHFVFGWQMRQGMDRDMQVLWNGILAGFAGFCVHAFFDTIFYSVQHGALLWIFLGILAASRTISSEKKKPVLPN